MASPIEMVRGGERQTVYSAMKADALVADGWQRVQDLSPEQQAELQNQPGAPWRNFDEMSIPEILDRLADATDEKRASVLEYEQATKNRKGVIEGLSGLGSVEQQLEAETGHDVVRTGNEPPTFVETDNPAPTES